jgi:uncharacterized protein
VNACRETQAVKRVPLLTAASAAALESARDRKEPVLQCSLDLGRSLSTVTLGDDGWAVDGDYYPWPGPCRDHTVYYWDGTGFAPVARFGEALVKLVPTDWGPPTFEIDGVKMLPTATVSPWDDARTKVALVRPRASTVLDTCGGLGYFAAACLEAGAARIQSFEKNPDVRWLRSLNPWSPDSPWSALDLTTFSLEAADVAVKIPGLADRSVDAVLHDPPRFSLAGELYSADFYGQLARVLRRGGRLFHYTGAPNSRSRGRNLAAEVTARLRRVGFEAEPRGDGVLARRI